jgi:hypothetical protein
MKLKTYNRKLIMRFQILASIKVQRTRITENYTQLLNIFLLAVTSLFLNYTIQT